MSTKRTIFLAAAIGVLSAGPVLAQEVSFNATASSDYVFRGVTQTAGDPALQLGADISAGDFYAGVWGSNVDFGDGTDVEMDIFAGYAPSLAGFDFDFGWIRYTYPGAPGASGDQDFDEVYAAVGRSYGALSWDAKWSWSEDFYLNTGEASYLEAGLGWALSDAVSLDARYGTSRFDDLVGADYDDWQIGLSWQTGPVALGARWHDSDIDDSRFVASISYSLTRE
ncbi:MAG: TorF family putative porin [Proteobacteria bacterium]|nr:TorF family putative porin [Pseudomonadota bacterium]